jgi:nitrate reductase NapAB chaperone NapD
MPATSVHYSGILVVVPPIHLDDCRRALDDLPGVEVHHVHAESGRIVVVHESASLKEQEERLLQMRALRHVMLAEPVYHYLDSEPADADPATAPDSQERSR